MLPGVAGTHISNPGDALLLIRETVGPGALSRVRGSTAFASGYYRLARVQPNRHSAIARIAHDCARPTSS